MSQRPGQITGPMLWVVPRYPETPGSIMRLGSILTDPADLESSLNLDAIPPIPAESKRDASAAVKRHVDAELRISDSFLAKAVPAIAALFNTELGASAGAGRERNVSTSVDAVDVRATVFIPSKEYMDEALRHKRVQEYARKGAFGKSLYVVVGTATAGQLSVREGKSAGRSIEASAVAALPGGLGEAEATFERRRDAGTETEFEVDEACDFAYRVREFFYSKLRGRLDDKGNFTDSALFGRDGDKSGGGDDGVVFIPTFEWFEDEDPETRDLFTFEVTDDVSSSSPASA
ncbi:hypothetical protein QBC37DRAFT_393410 [Rhypophila decipiens]|uniref:Uncharacterized protein n=1 Tax=Rhypophila decipiens TaxID=261697 RepID=A0AAN6XTQ7_9PEZI|nr:hypothetical protein QBC37DRAFT_393410 [Rhypophila decipiens]